MALDAYVLSRRAIETLKSDHAKLRAQIQGLQHEVARNLSADGDYGKQIATGITSTTSQTQSYPTSGNVVPVKIEKWNFTESTGSQDIDYTVGTKYVMARTYDGTLPAVGTHVVIERQQGRPGRRWWIRSSVELTAARITTIGSTAIANTVQAETGTLAYTATTGRQTLTFTADSPQALITVHQMFGPPPRVNDLVIVTSVDGAYQVIHTNASDVLKAVVSAAAGIAVNSAGSVVVWKNGAATTRVETAWLNWMATATLAQNKKCVIRWFDDEQKWIIIEAEC